MENHCIECKSERIPLSEWNRLNPARKLQRANLRCLQCASNNRWKNDSRKVVKPPPTPCVDCGALRSIPKGWNDLRKKVREHWINEGLCVNCRTKSHGDSKHRLYKIWQGIRQRVGVIKNISEHNEKYYRAKGIKLCDEWLIYENFRTWSLANNYDAHLWIDRKENHKGYQPDNCRWVTKRTSSRNRTSVILNDNEVRRIRRRYKRGERIAVIAKSYPDLEYQSIWNVCKRKTWSDIPDRVRLT